VVLANMAQRMQAYQVEALHREKLIRWARWPRG
jgi:hypothetical protein